MGNTWSVPAMPRVRDPGIDSNAKDSSHRLTDNFPWKKNASSRDRTWGWLPHAARISISQTKSSNSSFEDNSTTLAAVSVPFSRCFACSGSRHMDGHGVKISVHIQGYSQPACTHGNREYMTCTALLKRGAFGFERGQRHVMPLWREP